ncbi:MAG: phage major capsid protein [Proteobacteria bacterium]|nr:phage major capsid protein [Pseudomonadota bacterium]
MATTLRDFGSGMADNVTNNIPLLAHMNEGGNIIDDVGGGRELFEPLIYGDLPEGSAGSPANCAWYRGYENFTVQTNIDQIDGSSIGRKQLGGFAYISGEEETINSGEAAIRSLIKARILKLRASMQNLAGAGIFSNGTYFGARSFDGLQYYIHDNPTLAGTVAGIDQVANPFWQNQTDSQVITSANILGFINNMELKTTRGRDQYDIAIADSVMYNKYWGALQQMQRITSAHKGKAGYKSLIMPNGSPLMYDPQTPEKHMYFVNTDYLKMKKVPNKWFTAGKSRAVPNADYDLIPMRTMGNMCCSNRNVQGVLIDTTP